MSLPTRVRKSLEVLREARDNLEMAEESLRLALPAPIADEIHYNGCHANIPSEYRTVLLALCPELAS